MTYPYAVAVAASERARRIEIRVTEEERCLVEAAAAAPDGSNRESPVSAQNECVADASEMYLW